MALLMIFRGILRILTLIQVLTLLVPGLSAQEPEFFPLDWECIKEEYLEILSEYLKCDTSNPPGNESEGVRLIASILEKEEIPYRILESAPGRMNLYARLEGMQPKPSLLLLHHADVVPANEEAWAVPPFSGEIRDGFVWGRGAMDMKGLGVIQLASFLALSRSTIPRHRDVILLVTADEEQGGLLGINWLVENHFDLFDDAGIALNEGGMNLVREGRIAFVGVEVTQKTPLWVRLTVRGLSQHGSVPKGNSAPARLIRALGRILDWETEARIDRVVGRFFKAIAPFYEAPFGPALLELSATDAGIVLEADDPAINLLSPFFRSLTRNTLSLTVLNGGEIINVVPDQATAELDCRLLPGEDPEVFLDQLREVIRDPAIQIEVILTFRSSRAPEESEVFDSIRRATARFEPDAVVGISVLPGFTDSHILREKGISAYGFSPFRIEETQPTGTHSRDEKISLEDLSFGLDYFFAVVSDLVWEEKR